MIIKVLGSAAGGGFPQWNCNCRNCAAVRAGTPGFRARTQSSLAVSRDGMSWALLNASPDLRQQIADTPDLHADPQARAAPQPDQGRGADQRRRRPHHRPDQPARGAALLDLRLRPGARRPCAPTPSSTCWPSRSCRASSSSSTSRSGSRAPALDLGLTVEAFAVPGKVALYLEDASSAQTSAPRRATPSASRSPIRPTRSHFFYIPGCADRRREAAPRG